MNDDRGADHPVGRSGSGSGLAVASVRRSSAAASAPTRSRSWSLRRPAGDPHGSRRDWDPVDRPVATGVGVHGSHRRWSDCRTGLDVCGRVRARRVVLGHRRSTPARVDRRSGGRPDRRGAARARATSLGLPVVAGVLSAALLSGALLALQEARQHPGFVAVFQAHVTTDEINEVWEEVLALLPTRLRTPPRDQVSPGNVLRRAGRYRH